MRPIERRESGQNDLLRSRLDQIIDPQHALVRLTRAIDWGFLEARFGAVYRDGVGRPPLPTRLMAGLPPAGTERRMGRPTCPLHDAGNHRADSR